MWVIAVVATPAVFGHSNSVGAALSFAGVVGAFGAGIAWALMLWGEDGTRREAAAAAAAAGVMHACGCDLFS